MKQRVVLIIVLLILLFLGTTESFTYWDKTLNDKNNSTINIGVGAVLEVNQTIMPEDGKYLVPVGALKGENDVDEIIYCYTVNLNKQGNLTVAVKNIEINGNTDNNNLISIDIYSLDMPNATPSTEYNVELNASNGSVYQTVVTVKVTLNAPSTEEEYNALKSGQATFELEFKATEV